MLTLISNLGMPEGPSMEAHTGAYAGFHVHVAAYANRDFVQHF
jgi:hypothetical protein